ncbi:MAG: hypothetical protein RLZZ226_267 [Pseudomonadota bacterium]
MSSPRLAPAYGPYTAADLKDGDPYELSQGHRIECLPAGGNHAGINSLGASVIDSDPDVEWSGVDAGFELDPVTLRAPDVAVAPAGQAATAGWIQGVPPLAIEYASRGQDEAALQQKIAELLSHGTRYIWVVRLTGPRRVEIHTPGTAARVASPGETLSAPGVLRNPVPVEALYDREAGRAATLRNLLQREGYADLDAVLEEGVAKGKKEGLEKGIAKGKKEGWKEGLEKGIAKGKKEGRKEGLEKGVAKGKRAGKKEGMAIGLEKGITRGQQQGKKLVEQLFILLLENRFGIVPEPLTPKIATASLEEIEHWIRRAVTASCLDDIFNSTDSTKEP